MKIDVIGYFFIFIVIPNMCIMFIICMIIDMCILFSFQLINSLNQTTALWNCDHEDSRKQDRARSSRRNHPAHVLLRSKIYSIWNGQKHNNHQQSSTIFNNHQQSSTIMNNQDTTGSEWQLVCPQVVLNLLSESKSSLPPKGDNDPPGLTHKPRTICTCLSGWNGGVQISNEVAQSLARGFIVSIAGNSNCWTNDSSFFLFFFRSKQDNSEGCFKALAAMASRLDMRAPLQCTFLRSAHHRRCNAPWADLPHQFSTAFWENWCGAAPTWIQHSKFKTGQGSRVTSVREKNNNHDQHIINQYWSMIFNDHIID